MHKNQYPKGTRKPRPATRGRYLIRSRKNHLIIATIDRILEVFCSKQTIKGSTDIRKILVSNWAHIGDVLLTLPAISVIRREFPEAQIGMIVGSWSKKIIEDAKLVDRIHVIDPWLLNRSDSKRKEKVRQFLSSMRVAISELRHEKYDVAIDFYPYFPPAHPLFFWINIQRRIGYESNGFGRLLTDSFRWNESNRSMSEYSMDLVDALAPNREKTLDSSWKYPEPLKPEIISGVCSSGYVVLHPGAGAPFKAWPEIRWVELLNQLVSDGIQVLITGSGEQEIELAERLAKCFNRVISFAGRTTWREFVGVVQNASAIICVDSAAAHVAALFNVPSVVIFTGTNNMHQWAPNSKNSVIITRAVSCAPCYRAGCESMACIREVTVSEVLNAFRNIHRTVRGVQSVHNGR